MTKTSLTLISSFIIFFTSLSPVGANVEKQQWLLVDSQNGVLTQESMPDGTMTFKAEYINEDSFPVYNIEVVQSISENEIRITLRHKRKNFRDGEEDLLTGTRILALNDRGNWDLVDGSYAEVRGIEQQPTQEMASLPFNNEDFAIRLPEGIDQNLIFEFPEGKEKLEDTLIAVDDSTFDPLVAILKMDMALLDGEEEKLEGLIIDYSEVFEESDSNFFRQVPRYYEIQLENLRISKGDKEISRFMFPNPENESLRTSVFDSNQLRSRYNKLTSDFHYVGPLKPLLLKSGTNVPNFLIVQTLTKVIRVISDFDLIQGNPNQAAETLIGGARLGVIMNNDGIYLITQLIGIAVVSLNIPSLELLVKSGALAQEDHSRVRDEIHSLYNDYLLDSAEQEFARAMYNREASAYSSFNGEAQVRRKTVKARLALLSFMADIQLRQLEGAELSEGLIRQFLLPDPYGEDRNLSYHLDESGDYTLWSVGPDKISQEAAIKYDPTNGTWSRGDLILSVHAEREYPFPSSPEQLNFNSMEEVLNHYPVGLPPDPFADSRGLSYTVSDTEPPLIWSFGPDVDRARFEKFQKNIMIGRNEAFGFNASPPMKFGDTRLETMKVKEPDEEEPERMTILPDTAHAFFKDKYIYLQNLPEEPMYDPTNGTVSEGNVYHDPELQQRLLEELGATRK